MKVPVLEPLLVRYKEKAKTPLAKLCFFLIGMSLLTYTFFAQTEKQEVTIETKQKTLRSVSIVNGIYKIDTAVIWSNRNKDALLFILDKQKLTEKNNKAGMPDFIKAFLDSISPEKKFNMADPGEKWWTGDIKDLIFTRLYESSKNCETVICDKQGLPDKAFAYFGIGKSIAVLSYYAGGIGLHQNTIMIEFENKKVINFWFNNYDSVFSTKAEMLSALRHYGNC